MHTPEACQDGGDFLAGEDRRQARRRARSLDMFEPRQLALEHIPIEEEDRALGEVLRGCRDVVVDSQAREKGFDFRCSERFRVTLAVLQIG
jgi:hypothetical protein